jgi:sugar fermentation stimulation protein A
MAPGTSARTSGPWIEASFVDRPNRFTAVLEGRAGIIRAYLPNTGRLEEYCVEGNPFYLLPFRSPKFSYRVVSSLHQNRIVLLDTMMVQRVAERMLSKTESLARLGLAEEDGVIEIVREVRIGDNRFDLCVRTRLGRTFLFEIKSCTLCHNRTAMFPDAPSLRALEHLRHLSRLAEGPVTAALIVVVPNPDTDRFIPNLHTDPAFAARYLSETRVLRRVFSLTLRDPVTPDPDGFREIPVDWETARRSLGAGGSYLLILENGMPRRVVAGSLGRIDLRPGYYVYAGSALSGLDARIARHRRRRKNPHWHIDHLTMGGLKVVRDVPIRRRERIEQALARRLSRIADGRIEGFGASDSGERSHLFFFTKPPHRLSAFQDLVCAYRTFTEDTPAGPP